MSDFCNVGVSNYNLICDLEHELAKARQGWPRNADALPALMEEVGELAQALIQMKHEPAKGRGHEEVYREAIQVACMALRIASEGEPGFPYDPESGYRGPDWSGYVPPSEMITNSPAESLKQAISRSGLDVSFCQNCSQMVVCIPDGMSNWCETCLAKEQENA